MKTKIYSLFALGLMAFTACDGKSDNDNVNSLSGVTVDMQEMQLRIGEDFVGGNYSYVPVIVKGETNGDVIVTISCAQIEGGEPVVEPDHYVFTSKTITIPEGESIGAFEFYSVGDDVINDDRQFVVTITDVKGASIGTESSCIVTLVDNEGMIPRAYQDVQGMWTAVYNSHWDGDVEVNALIYGVEEGEEGYNSTLYLAGVPQDGCVMAGKIIVDGATGVPSIQFNTMQTVGEFNFTDIGKAQVKLVYASGTSFATAVGPITAVGNAEHSTVLNFDFGGYPGCGFLIFQNNNPVSWFESVYSIKLSR